MPQPSTSERILNKAEHMARRGGYNAFSFREIANAIGIKSASVHYHFPTKEALGAALADRYTKNFLTALGRPDDAPPKAMLKRFVGAYRHAMKEDGLMCLCGMFGAEIAELPPLVAERTKGFFEQIMAWLAEVYSAAGLTPQQCQIKAGAMIATLEGAMILAQSLDDTVMFDQIAETLA